MRLRTLSKKMSIILCLILIFTQIQVFAATPFEDQSSNDTFVNLVNSNIHNEINNADELNAKIIEIQSSLSNGQGEHTSVQNQHLLVETYDNSSKDIVSIATNEIQDIYIDSNSEISIAYFKDGKLQTGRYMEKDIRRRLHGISPAPTAIAEPKTAEAISKELGYEVLKDKVDQGNEEIIVAVIDTGVDTNNSFLKDRLVQGYDVIGKSTSVKDDDGHGTHVAGIIASSTPNNVKIMPINVFDDSSALDSSIVSGIYYAVTHKAKIINLSLGGYGKTSYLEKGIQYARNNGVMLIVSSGNDAHNNEFDYPAAFKDVITVGATNTTDTLLYYSNFGESVDICAPGEKVISTYLDNTTESLSGTSMASPFISAAAALLWLDNPNTTLTEIETILLENTKDLGPVGKDIAFGNGEIDLSAYTSEADFHLIGFFENETAKTPEFKYDMPLKYYASPNVESASFSIDGQVVLNVTENDGIFNAPIDIRKFAAGNHKLAITTINTDGSTATEINGEFIIPDYNVVISIYDYEDNLITPKNTRVTDMYGPFLTLYNYSYENSIYYEKIKNKLSSSTFNLNIDFTKEAKRNNYLYLQYSNYNYIQPQSYFRSMFSGGSYIVDRSTSAITSFSTDRELTQNDPITLKLPIIFSDTIINNSPNWKDYHYSNFFNITPTSEGKDENGLNYYYFYHDISDFILNIDLTIYNNKGLNEANSEFSMTLYNDFISNFINDSVITIDTLNLLEVDKTKNIDIDTNTISITDILYNSGRSYTLSKNKIWVPNGIYDAIVFANNENVNSNFSYIYRNQFEISNNSQKSIIIGENLSSELWTNISPNLIYNQWIDNSGSYANVFKMKNGVTSGSYKPIMLLKNTSSSQYIKLTGSASFLFNKKKIALYSTDCYNISNVPDGIYEITFDLSDYDGAVPIENQYMVVEIKSGEVLQPSNTNPHAVDSITKVIIPYEVLQLDLNTLFWDDEQSELFYSTSDGIVMNNQLYYQDLLKKDTEIEITAYDGVGGSVKSTIEILIGKTFMDSNDFTPIKEIINLGASNWAKNSINDAIDLKIINNDILSNYQLEISREEVCEQLIKMIERKKGQIGNIKGISFQDTSNESILKVAKLGIVTGSGTGEFNPNYMITREQFCTVLYKTAQLLDSGRYNLATLSTPYQDAASISSWAKDGTTFCINNKIITGANGILSPKGMVTREQAIVMLVKLMKAINNKTLK
ncbi:S8 family peptidase [Fusibacter bizertensis]